MELDFDQHNSLSSWTYPYFVTEYIKNSTHGLERLLSYDVDCNSSLCHDVRNHLVLLFSTLQTRSI